MAGSYLHHAYLGDGEVAGWLKAPLLKRGILGSNPKII